MAAGEIEPWAMQTEFLVRGNPGTALHGRVRFLQAMDDGAVTEREVVMPACALNDLADGPITTAFAFRGWQGRKDSTLEGSAELAIEAGNDPIVKIGLRIANEAPASSALMLSTHAVLGVENGRFLSSIDPPDDARALAATCRNRGAWPVLVGDQARHDMLLAAPIILYDFPQVAPESPGDLFDGTEIDEILTLRILTLTDAEKDAMRRDERTRGILERTEHLTDAQLAALHGAWRTSAALEPGMRVRLHPRGRADILDLALDGKRATIASIEQDFEGRVFFTVTLDDDPGRDLGHAGKPGHRFFFSRAEIELL
ncbi:MAG: hypothetical protein HY289_09420 [Planctomycetes bacterium]|nr:hypothetical protein [Planctomycetota bacterium]